MPANAAISVPTEKAAAIGPDRRPEAVVLGNGHSLRGFDFGRLSRFDVFGMNAAYRYWYETGWFPQYYSCLDLVVGASHRDAIAGLIRESDRLGIRAFLLRRSLIDELGRDGAALNVFDFDLLRPGFESWIPGPVTTGSHTCAWASILGYRDIYLLGIDCNYVEIVANAEPRDGEVLEITSDAPNPNYFFDAYQKKGDKFNIPNPRKDLHLESWRNIGGQIGSRSRVLNAGFGSKVDQFPFVLFDDLEKGGRVPVFSPLEVIGGAPSPEAVDHVLVPSGGANKPLSPSLSKSAPPHPGSTNDALPFKQLRSILAYDAAWSYTDAAEQHAFFQADKLLPEVPGVMYFGFPWATLIDRLNSEDSSADSLKEVINGANLLLNEQKHVVTVCQHADMLKYRELFEGIGITHVFWAHAVKGQDCFPGNGNIRIFPFPLFSGQATAYLISEDLPLPTTLPPLQGEGRGGDGVKPASKHPHPPPVLPLEGGGTYSGRSSLIRKAYASSHDAVRKYLYSFVEPGSEERHLGNPAEMILDHLAGRQGSLVIPRVKWDFNYVLHGTGIHAEAGSDQESVHRAAPVQVRNFLRESIFSLCHSGSGPNSTQLWESICCGAIPVVLSDDYLPPGNRVLWEQATVSCPERLEDILALPDRLQAIARDPELLERKRHALRQLWMIYGPDCFIYDICKLFLSLATETVEASGPQPTHSYGKLLGMASELTRSKSTDAALADVFILGCSSRLLSDAPGFLARYQENKEFRMAYQRALASCKGEYAESMSKALEVKRAVLENMLILPPDRQREENSA